MRHKKAYHEMETSRADMTDFRRPPYTVQRAIRAQSEQIRETPAEYVARKYGIRGDADGHNKGTAPGVPEQESGDSGARLHTQESVER